MPVVDAEAAAAVLVDPTDLAHFDPILVAALVAMAELVVVVPTVDLVALPTGWLEVPIGYSLK